MKEFGKVHVNWKLDEIDFNAPDDWDEIPDTSQLLYHDDYQHVRTIHEYRFYSQQLEAFFKIVQSDIRRQVWCSGL